MFICKHCKQQFNFYTPWEKANHSRWCHSNPKRTSYNRNVDQLNTPDAIKKRSKKIADAHATGKYDGAAKKGIQTKKERGNLGHTEETKNILREKALNSKHRRLVRSVREYIKKDGAIVLLDSSWEEALAKRLDSINVEWIRPKDPIEYIGSDGKTHNYFPDFYLPQQDLYLDPKNPMALLAQKDKLDSVQKILTNLVIIRTLNECNEFKC